MIGKKIYYELSMEYSVYFPFLLDMWRTKQITQAKLELFTPFYISTSELAEILATPQMTEAQLLMAQTI